MSGDFETAAALKARQDASAGLAMGPATASAEIAEWSPPKEWSRQWQDLALDLIDPERKLSALEVAYFFTRAKALSLDPLARQIFPVKLNGRMEPFVGIHGIRMLAERTGQRGSESVTEIVRPLVQGTGSTEGAPLSVTVTVERVRNGAVSRYPFTAKATEFAQKEPPLTIPNPGGTPDPMTNPLHRAWERSSWATKPEVMLTKCAAANAYRMAFPEVLGGLYIPEEIEAKAE